MIKASRRGGAFSGAMLVLCFMACLFGLGFELSATGGGAFWIGARPGAAAVIGAAAAVFCGLAAAVARALFIRGDRDQ